MENFDILLIILAAGIIHASMQLSISVLSLMSGHSFGKKTAARRVTNLAFSYSLGSLFIILLLLSFLSLVVQGFTASGQALNLWIIVSLLAVATGLFVWVFYFRRGKKGTVLWVPRTIARFLSARAKSTRLPFEAFGLGLLTPAIEVVFSITPLLIAAVALSQLSLPLQLVGLFVYAAAASLPHFVTTAIIGGGRSIARIQKWRETNKRFIQFSFGGLLIILGCYLYIDMVMPYVDWSAR